MIRFLGIVIVLLGVGGLAAAHGQERFVCPTISVFGPAEILKPGETARFTVKFQSPKPETQLKYIWDLSSGKIVSGNGTESIEVAYSGSKITATVQIRGGDEACHVVSDTAKWDQPPIAEKVRVFTTIDGRTAVPLAGNNHQVIIFLGLRKNASEETARQREVQILEKLDDEIDRNQTTIIRVYGGVEITEFWSVPPGAQNPECDGCEPAKVEKQTDCPTISVTGPAGIPRRGELYLYTSSIKGTIPPGLVYRWTVSNGALIEGQGTPNAKIAPDPNRNSVTVTLELIGLPTECPNIASEGFVVDSLLLEPILVDEFSAPMSKLEKERLKNAVDEQKNNPNNQLYIIEYFPKNISPSAMREKVSRVTNFLVKELKLDESFLTIMTEKAAKPLTKIYRIPPGAANPIP